MKKTALILLLIFSFVQAVPAVCSLLSPSSSVFMVDEEKGGDKIEKEKKDKKKDYPGFISLESNFSHEITTAFHIVEKIYTPPCIEKVCPPPNFC